MNERDLWWKIVLVGTLVALAFASVHPIDQKMKFGIDLAGGYSLLYELDDTGMGGADRTNLSKRVIEVLRKRVDPNNVFNLVWRPVGHNRIEIQMPRPSEAVKEARQRKEDLLEQLQSTILRRSDVLAAVARQEDPAVRQARFERLADGLKERIPLLEAAARAYEELRVVEEAYQTRKKEIEAANVRAAEIHEALRKPAAEREAAIAALVRGVEGRELLLRKAVDAWDAYRAANRASTQPAEGPVLPPSREAVAELQKTFRDSVEAVLATNVDPEKLTEGATLDRVVELEEVFDEAVARVLNTNLELGSLQTVLDMKPTDKQRPAKIAELTAQHPGLADLISGLVEATDELNRHRRGEGRLEDPADLQRLLKGAGVLDFRILPTGASDPKFDEYRERIRKSGPRPKPGEERYAWFEIEDPADFLKLDNLEEDFEKQKLSLPYVVERFGDKYYVLSEIGEESTMTHSAVKRERDWSLKNARFTRDRNGGPAIGFTLDEIGGAKFGKLTRRHKGRQLCIFLDDLAISSARINDVITTNGIIEGNFTPQEVNDMVKKLNAGSLPQKLKDPPISIRSIGPSLGEANREAGLRAAKYGAICVAIFMLIYYFYAGAIAVIAVAFNILFIGAMMSALGATLTLPGIAGLVLAIGMAVDANVLINERIREELARGTAMRMAIKLGYERALRAILDSNVTTVLTCVILYMVGSEQVKGFGLTLGVGVFINIFTAYFITRMFFDLMAMISVPREIVRYPIYAAVGVTGFGALIFGLGYGLVDPAERSTSVSIAFGGAIMEIGPTIAGMLVLMFIARWLHHGRKTLPMLRLIGVPKFDWVGKRHVFFGLSAVMIAGSLFAFMSLDQDEVYDIEFLGGVSAQIDLKEAGSLDQTGIAERLARSGRTLERFAEAMAGGEVSGQEGTYTIRAAGVPAFRLEPVLKAELKDELGQTNAILYEDPAAEEVTIHTREDVRLDPAEVKTRLSQRFKSAAQAIRTAQVQAISSFEAGGEEGKAFSIVSRETAKEIVVAAIMETMEHDIDVQPALTFKLHHDASGGDVPYLPVRESDPRSLGIELSESAAAAVDLHGWEGGVAIVLEQVNPPQSVEVLKKRLRAMRLQPGFEKHGWRESDVFGLDPVDPGSDVYSRLLIVVADENYPLEDEEGGISPIWRSKLAEPEVELIQAALQRQTSLSQITQFDTQVSDEAQIQAYLALALSWLLIIVFVWFRFGNIRWGLSAVVALIHDVIIALGAVSLTFYIADKLPALGSALMINEGFRIDLAMVAALLTVIGYSVNDTIVVFDRIRENRGRLTEVTPQMVNDSVSQTLSRTLLTFLSSLISVLIMYIFGGRGIHSFNFVLLIGLAVGTYSSIGVASQFLLRRRQLVTA